MLQSVSSRAEIRRQLDQVLRTDADLDAFCLDYFPDAHLRFAQGMERTDKVTLLLSLVELADITAKLRERASRQVARHQRPDWGRAGIVAALAIGGCLYAALQADDAVRGQADLTASAAASRCAPQEVADPELRRKAILRQESTSSPTAPVDVNSGNVIDRSPDAEMHNRARIPAGNLPACVNCGNRIQGSRGAKMDNRVTVTQ
mgnify:CR=1 FL=1